MTVARYDSCDVGSQPDPEGRLAELAHTAGPLRRCVAAVAGRMLACRGWEPLGYASPGDYSRERLGVSASSLHEWARVDVRLADLPRLDAALVCGALPWSKVRLLARFVGASNEGAWIAHAQETPVRVLERQVRAVDRAALECVGAPLDEDGRTRDAAEPVRIAGPPALCLAWQRVRRYAARVSGEDPSAGAVLEMVTAETLSALPGQDGASGEGEVAPELEAVSNVRTPGHDGAPVELAPRACEPPQDRSLPRFLRSLVVDLEDAGPFELDSRLRRAVRLEQRLDALIGPLLRQVASADHLWRGRYVSFAAYAREVLGLSPRKARALVRLERAADACPALRHAYRDGAISWLQAQTVAPLLLHDHEVEGPWREAWVDFAKRVTVRRLEELVEYASLLRDADPHGWARLSRDPEELARVVDGSDGEAGGAERQVCAAPRSRDQAWRLTISAPRDVARLFRAALCSVRRAIERQTGRMPSQADAFELMIQHALDSWGVEEPWLARWMKRVSPVFQRDGWRCTVPGCSSRRNLHAHHIVFRSAGGSDHPANLTTLCATHHQRGVHGGRVRIRGSAPDALHFELGLRPGLPPLARYRSGDLVT